MALAEALTGLAETISTNALFSLAATEVIITCGPEQETKVRRVRGRCVPVKAPAVPFQSYVGRISRVSAFLKIGCEHILRNFIVLLQSHCHQQCVGWGNTKDTTEKRKAIVL